MTDRDDDRWDRWVREVTDMIKPEPPRWKITLRFWVIIACIAVLATVAHCRSQGAG